MDSFARGLSAAYKTQKELEAQQSKQQADLERETQKEAARAQEKELDRQNLLEKQRMHDDAIRSKAKTQGLNTLFGDSDEPTAGGKITTYGPYEKRGNDANVGSFGDNKLGPGSAALSPDLEKSVVSQGGKPKGSIEVTFDDGTSKVVNWDDRTNPRLTGRVDLWSPTAENPLEGKAVTSVKPVDVDMTGKPVFSSPVAKPQIEPSQIPAITAQIPPANLSASTGAGAPAADLNNFTSPTPANPEDEFANFTPGKLDILDNALSTGAGNLRPTDAAKLLRYAKSKGVQMTAKPQKDGGVTVEPMSEAEKESITRKKQLADTAKQTSETRNKVRMEQLAASETKALLPLVDPIDSSKANQPSLRSVAGEIVKLKDKPPSVGRDTAILDNFVRIMSGGVVREGQVRLLKGNFTPQQIFEQLKAKYTGNNQLLPREISEDLVRLTAETYNTKLAAVNSKLRMARENIIESGKKNGIDVDKGVLPKEYYPILTKDNVSPMFDGVKSNILNLESEQKRTLEALKQNPDDEYLLDHAATVKRDHDNLINQAKYIQRYLTLAKDSKSKYGLNEYDVSSGAQGIPSRVQALGMTGGTPIQSPIQQPPSE
jgi:hypothetical protein